MGSAYLVASVANVAVRFTMVSPHIHALVRVPVRTCTQLHGGADYVAVSIAVPTASNAVMSQILLFSVVQLGCWLCSLSGLFSLSWCLCTHVQRKIEHHMA
jgi:hypothetical protein